MNVGNALTNRPFEVLENLPVRFCVGVYMAKMAGLIEHMDYSTSTWSVIGSEIVNGILGRPTTRSTFSIPCTE
jgi:hypothetical protein